MWTANAGAADNRKRGVDKGRGAVEEGAVDGA
jgi:hypothetical protein